MKMSLTDKAYEIIKGEIITCVLEPGQQIVQSQLAERYQLGTTPIREALQRLAQEGFINPIPRFGYIVSPVTFSDVHEMFEVRLVLESTAARYAAIRGSERQLEEISRAANFTYVYKDRRSYSQFLARNTDFHRSVAIAGGNQRLADLVSKQLDQLLRVSHMGLDLRDSTSEMQEEHIALAKALCDRDPERAEQIARDQIIRSQQRILEALTRGISAGPSNALSPNVQVRHLDFDR